MLRSRRRTRSAVGTAVMACALFAIPRPAAAVDDDRGRPWGRGTVMPTLGFGLGLGQDITRIGIGLGASYFVWHGLAVGLGLNNQFLIYSSAFKNRYPGVDDQIPTNIFRITPSLQYVFYRSRWFSPYVSAGLGPTFFNNQGGVHAHWIAGPGAFIGLGGPVFLDVGVNFSGMFPSDRCNDAFVYEAPTGERGRLLDGVCSFGWGPRLGLILAFGAGRSRGRAAPPRRSSPPPRYEPAPENPMQPEPAPAPASEPWPEPEPEPPSEPPAFESDFESEPEAEPAAAPEAEPEPMSEPELDEPPPGLDPE